MTPAAMIDRQKFEENFRGIDKEVIISIIDIFEEEYPRRISGIHWNILEEDFTSLAFNAHSLKGVVGSFLAEVPSELLARLELLAKENKGDEMISLFNQLQSSLENLLHEFKKIREDLVSDAKQ